VDIENFADAIVEALKAENPVDTSDFELLKQEYTWAGALDLLADRIDGIL